MNNQIEDGPFLIDLVGLPIVSAYPAELSGGQKQRVDRPRIGQQSEVLRDEAISPDPETTKSILGRCKMSINAST